MSEPLRAAAPRSARPGAAHAREEAPADGPTRGGAPAHVHVREDLRNYGYGEGPRRPGCLHWCRVHFDDGSVSVCQTGPLMVDYGPPWMSFEPQHGALLCWGVHEDQTLDQAEAFARRILGMVAMARAGAKQREETSAEDVPRFRGLPLEEFYPPDGYVPPAGQEFVDSFDWPESGTLDLTLLRSASTGRLLVELNYGQHGEHRLLLPLDVPDAPSFGVLAKLLAEEVDQ